MNQLREHSDYDAIDRKIPMIAWIMPVYNGEEYIQQAINSILRQPCRDFEIWVVDDGSTDTTAQVVKMIQDDRIHYIYQENAGVSAARNNGIQRSHSRYVAFLDADDVMCKDVYDENLHMILDDGKYELLSFFYIHADQNLKKGLRGSLSGIEKADSTASVHYWKHFCSFIYQKSFFTGDTAIRFPDQIHFNEDTVFLYLVLNRSKEVYISDRPWFVYRNNIASVVHRADIKSKTLCEVSAWTWCKKQCSNKENRDECDAWIFQIVSEYIRCSCMDGISIETIQETVAAASIQETLENYDALWQRSKNVYEAFIADPEGYRKKLRKKGRVYSLARNAARLPGIRQVYMRMKYKEDIRTYIINDL